MALQLRKTKVGTFFMYKICTCLHVEGRKDLYLLNLRIWNHVGNCCWVSHACSIQICLWQGISCPPDSLMGWTLKNSEQVFSRSTESHQVPLSCRQSADCQNILHTWDLEDWIWTAAIFLLSLFLETLHDDPLAILNWVNVSLRRKAQHSLERKEGMWSFLETASCACLVTFFWSHPCPQTLDLSKTKILIAQDIWRIQS